MKRYFIAFMLAAVCCVGSFAQEVDSVSVAEEQANFAPAAATSVSDADKLARDGNYAEAADAYEALLNGGQESAELYYNLGYCYFKQGMLGKSILSFERSKRLNPSDPDVLANLAQAYALTDKLVEVEPPLIDRMWVGVTSSFGSDGWAWLFIVFFALTITGVACFLFLDSVAMRKSGFFSGVVFLVLAVFSLCISISKRSEIKDSSEAIIMVSSTDLNTSPDKNATRMTVLHEGTYVKIIDTLGEWIEVRLNDGNIGWLKLSDVEKI